MGEVKISIVIPNLNSGRYLGRSLDSIFRQSYKDFDVIVADGGSTDTSLDILYWYQEAHSNLHVYSTMTEGAAAHINDGMKQAQGDIVSWLCADDTYAPGCFRAVVDAFQNPDAEWVYGRGKIIDEDGNETRAIVTRLKELLQPRYSYLALQCASFIIEPTVFMRRSFQQKVGRYDEALPLVADYDYWLRAGKLSRPVFIDRHTANWRARYGSVSLSNYEKQMVGMYELQRKYSPPWLRPAQWTALQFVQVLYRQMNRKR